jgi:CRISPR-associated protein Cmr1
MVLISKLPLSTIEKKYQCEIVTPMFLGGADNHAAEMRAASLKGVLRFWWRATRHFESLEDMKNKEDSIFGSTEGRSAFSLKINSNGLNQTRANLPPGINFTTHTQGNTRHLPIMDYLSFGPVVYDRAQHGMTPIRNYFSPGQNFIITCTIHRKDARDDIERSFAALFAFGGLGSKTRNGFGGISVEGIGNTNPHSFKIPGTERKTAHCSLSTEAELFQYPLRDSWDRAISDCGLAYREARLSLERSHQFSKRGYLAKPLIARGEHVPNDIKTGRYAKQVFLKVNKLSNGKYQGQILVLPVIYQTTGHENQHEYDSVMNQFKRQLHMHSTSGGSL